MEGVPTGADVDPAAAEGDPMGSILDPHVGVGEHLFAVRVAKHPIALVELYAVDWRGVTKARVGRKRVGEEGRVVRVELVRIPGGGHGAIRPRAR